MIVWFLRSVFLFSRLTFTHKKCGWFRFFLCLSSLWAVDTPQVTFSLIKSASHSMFEFYMNADTAQHPNFTTRLIVVIIRFFLCICSYLVVVEKLCARLLVCAFSFCLSLCRFTFLFSSCRFSLSFSFPLSLTYSLPLSWVFCVCCWFFLLHFDTLRANYPQQQQ